MFKKSPLVRKEYVRKACSYQEIYLSRARDLREIRHLLKPLALGKHFQIKIHQGHYLRGED